MTEENKQFVYKIEDIFEEIPEDPENINMIIPPEVAEKIGLEPGDPIKILWGDQGTIIVEKISKEDLENKISDADE